MTARRHTLIGLFFVLVTGILGWFTLFKSDLSLFAESFPMTAYFKEGGGLHKGDSVLVAGMRWGRVVNLEYHSDERDMDRRVKVEFTLEHEVTLYDDHVIEIEDATVLGGKRLSIEPGTPDRGLWEGDLRPGTVKPNVMEAVGNLVSDNRDNLKSVIDNLAQVSETVNTEISEGDGVLRQLLSDGELAQEVKRAVTEIADTFENLKRLTDKIDAGQGTLGQLLADEELYGTIKSIAADLQDLFGDLANHEGILGALLDEEDPMLDQARKVVADLQQIVADAEAGVGTVGLLLKDEELRDNVAGIVDDLEQGRGTIGKLLKDEEVYDDIRQISDNLLAVSDRLASGEGTIGKLVNDQEIYDLLLKAVRSFTGSLEEAREAAPISTFLNTVFLGF